MKGTQTSRPSNNQQAPHSRTNQHEITASTKGKKTTRENEQPTPQSREQQQQQFLSDEQQHLLDYHMESNEFDYEVVKASENFGIKQYKDAAYKGELRDRKRDGKGVIIYNNGRVYEGEWVEDKRHGRGYERFINGNTYQGEFVNGKANGKGLFTWSHGEVYDGEWVSGVKEGYGIWRSQDGDSYIGQWSGSKADGYGVHVWRNGDRYEGEWRACLRHGNGSDFFSNDDQYIGQYRYGNPNGFGQYKWSNGNTYAGEFLDGMKHGKGKWRKKADPNPGSISTPIKRICNQFEGEYRRDKKNGYGEFYWQSGNIFKGEYKDDLREGYGEMYWVDGYIYRGYWLQSVQNGIGFMIFPDGFKKLGFFQDNVFKANLEKYEQVLEFVDMLGIENFPEHLNQEIKEYMGLNEPVRDSEDEFINKEIKPLGEGSKEDPPDETAFKNMQEIISANFGGFNGLTKSVYAAQIQEIDRQIEEEKFQDHLDSKDRLMESPKLPRDNTFQNDSKTQFSQNTSVILPEIQKKGRDYRSPYNDKMFINNKTQMMWKAVDDNGRSTTLHDSRLKYNEFDYVKRITVVDFLNEPKSLSEGRNSLMPNAQLQPLKEVRRKSAKRTPNKVVVRHTLEKSESQKKFGAYLSKVLHPQRPPPQLFPQQQKLNMNSLESHRHSPNWYGNAQGHLQPIKITGKVWMPTGKQQFTHNKLTQKMVFGGGTRSLFY